MLQLLAIAAGSLVQHRRRSLLVGGTIAAVTAVLLLLLALSQGSHGNIHATATILVSGDVNVGGFFKLDPGHAAPVVADASRVVELIRGEVPELESIGLRGLGMASVSSDTGSLSGSTQLVGVDVQREPALRAGLRIREGSLDRLEQPGTILLFQEQANKLGARVGDVLTLSALTERGVHNTVDVRVAAIAENGGAMLSGFRVLLPNRTLRQLFGYREDSAGVLQLHLKGRPSEEQIRAVRERLRTRLARAGYKLLDYEPAEWPSKKEQAETESWAGQQLEVTSWTEEFSTVSSTLGAFDALIDFLAFILLLIVSTGLMNTLWLSIGERTREIGTLRAIGMQRRGVVGMFLLEGFLLGLSGTVAGAALGALVCAGLNAANLDAPSSVQIMLGTSDHLRFALPPATAAWMVAFITLCTTLVSIFPSLRAARLAPVTAMHHTG